MLTSTLDLFAVRPGSELIMNFFKKKDISRLNDLESRHAESLARIQEFAPNLEVVNDSPEQPPYLISHGEIKYKEHVSSINTAITIRVEEEHNKQDAEFSTNVGQLPDAPLSSGLIEHLNHKFDGKFLTFDDDENRKIDVVYTSRQPADWLDSVKFRNELEHHAKIQALVSPILETLSNEPTEELKALEVQPSQVRDIARQILDKDFDTHLLSFLRKRNL